jgi:hypothetical protein
VQTGKTLRVTDVVFQNPRGDSGFLQVRRGDEVLIEVNLDNFRDLDQHYVQALEFSNSEPLTLAVNCKNAGKAQCQPAALFSGSVEG